MLSPVLLDYLIVLLTVLAPACAGAVEFATQVPLLCAASLLMALDPRRAASSVPRAVLGLAGLLLASGAAAFLPSTWLGGVAANERLAQALQLTFPDRVTLQPWLTLETLGVLLLTLVWGHFLFTRAWTLRRAQILGAYSLGLALLAAFALLAAALRWHPPFWPNVPFGPCPNYNETGFLFGTGGLLAFVLALRKSSRSARPTTRVALWFAVMLLFGAALIFTRSRSGILIFVLGPLAWLALCGAAKEMTWPETFRLALAVGLVGVLFFIFGANAWKRFADVPETPFADYRALIQGDAVQLTRAASFVGVGPGNFEAVFPFYRTASWNEKRAVHPESDWLALAAEFGWLAVPLAWALLAWALHRAAGRTGEAERPLMLGAFVMGASLWLHGFIDMNAHRLGALWPVLLVLAACQPRPTDEAEKLTRPLGWRIAVIGLGGLALLAWQGAAFGWPIPGDRQRRELEKQFTAAAQRKDFSTAVKQCDAALALTPLDWQLYFQRACLTLASRGEVARAEADFARARTLEPNLIELPLLEARYWWQHGGREPAARALDETFRRGGHTEAMFDHVFSACRHDVGLLHALLVPASHQPATQLRYLRDAPPELFTEMLQLVERGQLAAWTDAQRAQLFRLWAERADRVTLPGFVRAHPEWLPHAWPALARVQLRTGQAEAACQLIAQWVKPPKLPQLESNETPAALRRRIEFNAADFGAVFLLSQQLAASGDADGALQTLTTCATRRPAPAYFHFLIYQLHRARRDWPAAAASWLRFDEAVLQTGGK